MRIVIIEDEPAALRFLKSVLLELNPACEIVATFPDTQSARIWLPANTTQYDLIFSDIRLSDGLSFEIFTQVEIQAPIIFVTAYDEYTLEAFQTNGIGYILKPVDRDQVSKAIEKYHTLKASNERGKAPEIYQTLIDTLTKTNAPRQSFLVHHRDKLIPLKASHIVWIQSSNETTLSRLHTGQTYGLDTTLEKLSEQLDPGQFFRVNRQFIINREFIREVEFYFNGRLSVHLTAQQPEEKILVSKARASEFKSWLNR